MSLLAVPETSPEAQRMFDDCVAEVGYVMNVTRLWAYQPHSFAGLYELLRQTSTAHGLTTRQRGVLIAACASTLGDSYCALAWGSKLAGASDARTAAGVLLGDDGGLTDAERALAAWARKVVRDPNGIGAADVQPLRDVGYSDAQIFGITVFVALRMALSTVNDALDARPDAGLRATAPAEVLDAVSYGRPIEDAPATTPAGGR